tara:strand:+ start:136 stop:447 length:312 start_codon:yes stop_codon:yes gene_type:complete
MIIRETSVVGACLGVHPLFLLEMRAEGENVADGIPKGENSFQVPETAETASRAEMSGENISIPKRILGRLSRASPRCSMEGNALRSLISEAPRQGEFVFFAHK